MREPARARRPGFWGENKKRRDRAVTPFFAFCLFPVGGLVLILVLLDAVELQLFAAVGAVDGAEVQDVLVDGDGVAALGAGDLVEGGLVLVLAAAAAGAGLVILVLVLVVVKVLVVDELLDLGEIVADLVYGLAEVPGVFLEVLNVVGDVLEDVEDGGEDLALLAGVVIAEALGRPLT